MEYDEAEISLLYQLHAAVDAAMVRKLAGSFLKVNDVNTRPIVAAMERIDMHRREVRDAQ